jgi:hypothetical protein
VLLEAESVLAQQTPCDRCGKSSERLVAAYWGPALCPACCKIVAADLDRHDAWPPCGWGPDEVASAGS